MTEPEELEFGRGQLDGMRGEQRGINLEAAVKAFGEGSERGWRKWRRGKKRRIRKGREGERGIEGPWRGGGVYVSKAAQWPGW